MNIVKVCMECGDEFESNIRFNNILSCPMCGSGDVYQPTDLNYDELNLEDCIEIYDENRVACICDADKKEIIFEEK